MFLLSGNLQWLTRHCHSLSINKQQLPAVHVSEYAVVSPFCELFKLLDLFSM